MSQTPSHYQSPSGITPWDLQKGMQTSGSPFVDARRCDAIKYAFRVKENMVADLRKAAHCLTVAADEMERIKSPPSREEPLGIYNGWPFWKDEGVWRAESKDFMLCSNTRDGLFADIDTHSKTP